jgi:hypothetical protein
LNFSIRLNLQVLKLAFGKKENRTNTWGPLRKPKEQLETLIDVSEISVQASGGRWQRPPLVSTTAMARTKPTSSAQAC